MTSDWKKDFDLFWDKFEDTLFCEGMSATNTGVWGFKPENKKKLEAFISQLLTQEREEGRKEGINEVLKKYNALFNQISMANETFIKSLTHRKEAQND